MTELLRDIQHQCSSPCFFQNAKIQKMLQYWKQKKSRLATKSYLHISLVSSRIISLLSTILNCFTFALSTSVFTCTTYILAGWWRTEISVRQKVHSLEQNLLKNPSDSPEACSLTTSRIFYKLHPLSQKLHLSHRKISLL